MSETDDLAGHTIEELSEYLDRGMKPADPSIDSSAGCQLALAALRRLRSASRALLELDAEREPPRDDRWVRSIIDSLGVEVRAGRDVPVRHAQRSARLAVTEGAVRGLIRAAGDTVGGVLIGRCRLDGDVSVHDEPITVRVDATVLWGENIPAAALRVREAIFSELAKHTELAVAAIDVTVHDVALGDDATGATDSALPDSTGEAGIR